MRVVRGLEDQRRGGHRGSYRRSSQGGSAAAVAVALAIVFDVTGAITAVAVAVAVDDQHIQGRAVVGHGVAAAAAFSAALVLSRERLAQRLSHLRTRRWIWWSSVCKKSFAFNNNEMVTQILVCCIIFKNINTHS